MKKFILVAAIVSAGLFVFAIGASAQGIKEGKWSMTMVTKMEGVSGEAAEAMEAMENMSPEEKAMMEQMMGGVGMRAPTNGNAMGITTTVTTCVTNQNPVPNTEEGCQQTHSLQGNTVNFETVCEDSKSTGQVTYENDFMRGLIRSHQTVDGKETDSTIEITGQYVGPC